MINDSLSAVNTNLTADGLQFNFATDGEGNYGFLGADGSLIPFTGGNIMEEFAISFNCIGRGYVSFAYDKSFAAGVAANFETHHFKVVNTSSFKIKTDGTYRIIKLYSYGGSSEKVLSDTTQTITAETVFNAGSGHSSETGAVYVTIVILVE